MNVLDLPPTWMIIPGLGYVVKNQGDRKSPNWGLFSFQTGVTNHLLTGMILQAPSNIGT